MAGEESSKPKNPFLSVVEPNAIVPPEMYEKVAFHGLLYDSIVNDLKAQGFKTSMALDVAVNDKIKLYMKIAYAILDGASLAGFDADDVKNTRQYMKYYLPVEAFDSAGNPVADPDKVSAAKNYIKDFTNEYPRVLSVLNGIKSKCATNGITLEGGRLSHTQVRQLLDAKREKCREPYDSVRANTEGDFTKVDKKGGTATDGILLRQYKNGLAKLNKMDTDIRDEAKLNVGRGIGAAIFTGLFAGSLILVAGAISPVAATAFGMQALGSTATIGQLATGAIGSFFSWKGVKKFFPALIEGIKKNIKARRERRKFIGPKITKRNLSTLLITKGKEEEYTLNELKARYYNAKATKLYFENYGKCGGDHKKIFADKKAYVDGEWLGNYLPKSLAEHEDYPKKAQRFHMVSDKNALYDNLFKKLPNEPTEVVGDGELGKTDVISSIENDLHGTASSGQDALTRINTLARTTGDIEHYTSKIGKPNATTYMEETGNQMAQAFDSAIFEMPHTGTSYDTVSSKAKDAKVKKALEAASIDDPQGKIDNSLAFYSSVKGGGSSPLKENVGVGVKNQLKFDHDSMVDGCKGVDSTCDDTVVGSVVDEILNLSCKEDVAAVQANINALPAKVQPYLSFMLEKKNAAVAYSESFVASKLTGGATSAVVAAAVAHAIDSLELVDGVVSVADIEAVKNDIATNITDPAKRVLAEKYLMEKVSALEQSQKITAYSEAVTLFTDDSGKKPTSYVATKSKTSKINLKIIEEDGEVAEGQSLSDFFDKEIKKGDLSSFAMVKFQSRVNDVLKKEATQDKYKSVGANATQSIQNITKYLQTLENCFAKGYISPGQRMSLVKNMEKNIEVVLASLLDTAKEKFLLQEYDENVFDNILKYSFDQGGLKDYLNSNTPTSQALKGKLEYMMTLDSIYKMLNQDDSLQSVKMSNSEARMFSKIYLMEKDERDGTDPLYLTIVDMQNACQTHNPTTDYEVSVYTGTNKGKFIEDMERILSDIETSSMTPQEKYAALLIAKKRSVAMYKSYITTLVNEVGGYEAFATIMRSSDGSAKLKECLIDRWLPYMQKIDATYNNLCASGLDNRKYPFGSAAQIINQATQTQKVASYSTSPTMEA